jgi:thioredoxin 1
MPVVAGETVFFSGVHAMGQHTIDINDDSFENSVIKSTQPVLVDFWAPWCGPCVAIAPVLDAIAEEYKGKVTIAKMNVDENAHVPATFGVRSIPFMALFKNGQMVDSVVGAVPKGKLVDMIKKVL